MRSTKQLKAERCKTRAACSARALASDVFPFTKSQQFGLDPRPWSGEGGSVSSVPEQTKGNIGKWDPGFGWFFISLEFHEVLRSSGGKSGPSSVNMSVPC